MSHFKAAAIQFRSKDNTEEITKKVRDLLSNASLFDKRLIDAFPNFKSVIVNIKKELEKTKKELKLARKELKKSNRKLIKIQGGIVNV